MIAETPLISIAEGGKQEGPTQASSVSLQASSPSAELEAAAAQVGDRKWNWEKKILYLTIEAF